MSIQDFHSQLNSATDQDPLMGALRALSQIEDPAAVTGSSDAPQVGWGIWDSTTA
jgi:hypothetical protein